VIRKYIQIFKFLLKSCQERHHKFMKTHYTPSLPVTIISPSAMAKEHGCEGYTSLSYLNNQVSRLKLLHCKRHAENSVFPATVFSGLPFSNTLILPMEAQAVSPLPHPVLHLRPGTDSDSTTFAIDQVTSNPNVDSTSPSCTTCPSCADAESSPLESSFCPSCCSLPTPTGVDLAPAQTLREKVLQYQRLGFQPDVFSPMSPSNDFFSMLIASLSILPLNLSNFVAMPPALFPAPFHPLHPALLPALPQPRGPPFPLVLLVQHPFRQRPNLAPLYVNMPPV
jgi:hypothetical protein